MTRLIVNRRLGYWPNLVVDVESYKARRKKMLTGLALRMAAAGVFVGGIVCTVLSCIHIHHFVAATARSGPAWRRRT